jgi:hypothetical protein
MSSVTPGIIEDVAKEFRLDTAKPLAEEASTKSGEMDYQRAMRILLERYGAR